MISALLNLLIAATYWTGGYFSGRVHESRSNARMAKKLASERRRLEQALEDAKTDAAGGCGLNSDDGDVVGFGLALHLSNDPKSRHQYERISRAGDVMQSFRESPAQLDESLREDLCEAIEQIAAVLTRARGRIHRAEDR